MSTPEGTPQVRGEARSFQVPTIAPEHLEDDELQHELNIRDILEDPNPPLTKQGQLAQAIEQEIRDGTDPTTIGRWTDTDTNNLL